MSEPTNRLADDALSCADDAGKFFPYPEIEDNAAAERE